MPEPSAIRAKLATPLPTAVEVGLGNILFLEGELTSGGRVTQLEAAVGPNRAWALTVGAPPPGERVGSIWWQAIVPIASVREAFEAAVLLSVRTESETTPLELGRTRLEPGSPPPAAPDPGDLVAICMATHEPPPASCGRRSIRSARRPTGTGSA